MYVNGAACEQRKKVHDGQIRWKLEGVAEPKGAARVGSGSVGSAKQLPRFRGKHRLLGGDVLLQQN